ncbi:hypothetical protein XELAEV_18032201mg, partial [Xenopus laevis]
MNFLPQILYLFRTLQISLSLFYYKQPRVKFQTAQLSRAAGGLGIPNIKFYHTASIMESAVRMHTPLGQKNWIDLEAGYADLRLLKQYFQLDKEHRPPLTSLLPTTRFTLQTWHKLALKHNFGSFPSPLFPLLALPKIIPHIRITSWCQRGIRLVADLYSLNSLATFDSLAVKYDLGPGRPPSSPRENAPILYTYSSAQILQAEFHASILRVL